MSAYAQFCGDLYTVEWDGNVWRRDDTGAQSAYAYELLRRVIEDSVRAGGDDPDDPEISAAIDHAMEEIEYD